jgi:hypothetical protein
MPANSTPITIAARERLRDQQQREARLLAAVLTAQRRLTSEREKADVVIKRTQRGIDKHEAALDETVRDLIRSSGITRAAILLDQDERKLARLARRHRQQAEASHAAEAGSDGVPA